MKSLLENKKVRTCIITVLILIVLLLLGLVVNNVNKINKRQDPKLQTSEIEISSEVIGSSGTDASGRELGKVSLNLTSNIPIDKVLIEKVDGTIEENDVNSTTYSKEIEVVYGHTHIISVVTSDGKISMHKISKEKPLPPISNPSTASGVRTGNALNFTWQEINEIAEIISNDSRITNNTQEFSLLYKGNNYTIGVGDYTTVNGYQVRIMGFNHDTLSSANAYGEGKNNTYAGISFEFVTPIITSAQMNSTVTNVGGWGECPWRATLNSTTINSLDNNEYIKEVNKQYIATYNDANSVTISQDKLWLLSCSEIWYLKEYPNNLYGGRTIAKEGNQYKYYLDYYTSYNISTPIGKNSNSWWLRSIPRDDSKKFCGVPKNGYFLVSDTNNSYAIAPGFCI